MLPPSSRVEVLWWARNSPAFIRLRRRYAETSLISARHERLPPSSRMRGYGGRAHRRPVLRDFRRRQGFGATSWWARNAEVESVHLPRQPTHPTWLPVQNIATSDSLADGSTDCLPLLPRTSIFSVPIWPTLTRHTQGCKQCTCRHSRQRMPLFRLPTRRNP